MIVNGKCGARALIAAAALVLTACGPGMPTPDEAHAIAKEAYIYGFPMVVGYKTMNAYFVDQNSPEYKGAFNHLQCEARLFTPEDRAVVTPNADTPYCMLGIDLRAEPMVLTVPEMKPERFLSFSAGRPLHTQLRLRGDAHNRQRSRHLSDHRPRLGRRETRGHHRRDPERNQLRP